MTLLYTAAALIDQHIFTILIVISSSYLKMRGSDFDLGWRVI